LVFLGICILHQEKSGNPASRHQDDEFFNATFSLIAIEAKEKLLIHLFGQLLSTEEKSHPFHFIT
jgi:hypothetical protein